MSKPRIESLLSARLFLAPQLARDRIYFISNMSGRLSLYAMDYGGSVPEPLLPPDIALQNPDLIGGHPFYVFYKLGKILVMLDKDGDENYQPMWIPMTGGFPEPAFDNYFANYRVHMGHCDREKNLAYFIAESRSEAMNESFQVNVETGELVKLAESVWGAWPSGQSEDHDRVLLKEGYSVGDQAMFLWEKGKEDKSTLLGTPLDQREEGQQVPLLGIIGTELSQNGGGVLIASAIHDDAYSLGYLPLDGSKEVEPVQVMNARHTGQGEMNFISHIKEHVYLTGYNIDGVSWVYEGVFDEENLTMVFNFVLCGEGPLSNGVLESIYYDKLGDAYALSFSTATSPTQIFTVSGQDRSEVTLHTRERILEIPQEQLSPGEDASFISFDGTRISARLYLPSESLGFEGPRPVVYYIHGGPQSQERPNFAWFSMPLIQLLTMNGFAVFVPNVRGSSGYGLSYMKQVDRDWGGKDRLDHVHAMTEILPKDERLDASRAAVVGRSYGGYMTLTLAGRHPELWAAAVDMFGPFDLFSFMERIPPTWKPYFKIALGDPEKDRDFLVERSPKTHIDNINSPLLVIQGKNDPRVVEQESRDLVEHLRSIGKDVEYLMFENEGHDVLKYENRVTCYNAINEYFRKHLKP
jgi:pimeloyl-ACP methyl ester carboxylesterase